MQSNKWEVEKEKKICYFDIDGVLNDYPECWLRFLREKWDRTELPDRKIRDLNYVKEQVPYQLYRNSKWEYRESGYKTTIPPTTSASELTYNLHQMRYHIVIITARPVKEHPSLFKQTVDWLQKNSIEFDDLIFDGDKHIAVLKRYPHLKFGVEDHRYYANLVASWGYHMYLLDSKYNQGEIHKNVTRIKSLVEILEQSI